MIFRFDDICVNTDMKKAAAMAALINSKYPNATILYCISPLVHNMPKNIKVTKERIFPKVMNAYSDFKKFYGVDSCGLPEIPEYVTRASHGLIHVDHRLLHKSAQEMSILTSCSLAKSNIYVPPFNKWNSDTEDICSLNGISLIKFEDGWLCAEYNDFDSKHTKWYLHSREFTLAGFKKWLM